MIRSRETLGGFCDACCYSCFTSLEVFGSLLFQPSYPTILWANARFTLTSHSAHLAQLIAERSATLLFSLLLLGFLFYGKCYSFERVFFTHKAFLPCNPSPRFDVFLTQMPAGTPNSVSSSMTALIELSLPAFLWSWTTYDPLVSRLLL